MNVWGSLRIPWGHFRVDKLLSKVSPTHRYSPGDNFTDHLACVTQLEAFVSLDRERVCPQRIPDAKAPRQSSQ